LYRCKIMRHGSSVRRVRLWLIVEISNAVIADGRKLRGVTALLNYIRCPDVILLKRLVRLFCSIYDFGWYQELSDRVQPLSNKLYSKHAASQDFCRKYTSLSPYR
jgi:hypothetical protein